MIILQIQNAPLECDACLSFLALGGIIALAGGVGYLISTFLNRDPSTDLTQSLISNEEALRLIGNYNSNLSANDAVSGHLDIGVLVSYIDRMKSACSTAGKEMSGLEYYFAKYGAEDHPPNQNQNTIVFYPTYIGTVEGVSGHIPFDPTLPFEGGDPISVKTMNDLDTGLRNARTGWYNSTNVLNRTHMSPPRRPRTL